MSPQRPLEKAELFELTWNFRQGMKVISWNMHSHVLFLNCEIGIDFGQSK
jgi:hypothetical protein